MFDDLNLSERDGDAAIMELFKQWCEACTAPGFKSEDDELVDSAGEHLAEIERQIFALPSSGAPGLAVKAYLVINEETGGFNNYPSALDARYTESGWLIGGRAKGLIADAVRFVPELAPLAAEFLAAPEREITAPTRKDELRQRAAALAAEFRGPLPQGDGGLIEAERRRDALTRRMSALSREFDITMEEEEAIIDHAGEKPRGADTPGAVEDELYRFIIDAEPETLAGVAVKLRLLYSIGGDPAGSQGTMLRQCIEGLDAIEREIAVTGARP